MIEVIPIGGYSEVGKNMTAIKIDDEIIILDMGLYLPAVLSYEEGDPHDLSTNDLIKIGAIPNDEILRKEKDKVKAIILSHAHLDHCLHPDTYIQLSTGEIKRIKDVQINNKLSCINFNTNKYNSALCKKKSILKSPKKILELRTKSKRIKVTEEHKLFVLNSNLDLEEKKASELNVGDFLATPKTISFEGKKQLLDFRYKKTKSSRIVIPKYTNPALCQFIGYVLGDGNKNRKDLFSRGQSLKITDKDINNLRFYKNLGEDLFNIKGNITLKKNFNSRNRISFGSPHLVRFINYIGKNILVNSLNRKVPELIHKLSKKEVSAFLRGLFDAEASVGDHMIRLASSSENIIYVTQMLFLRFGIHSQIYDALAKYNLKSNNDGYHLVIYYPKSIIEFSKKIGFSSIDKSKKLKILLKKIGKGVGNRVEIYPIIKFIENLMQTFSWSSSKLRKMGINKSHYSAGHATSIDKLNHILDILKKEYKISNKPRKHKFVKLINKLKKIIFSDMIFEPLKSIKYIESDTKEVIDISVPKYLNFIANSFIVHNCGAVPYLGFHYNSPIIGTPYTLQVLKFLLEEHNIHLTKKFKPLNYNSSIKISENIKVEFFPITHSTLQTVLVVIHTKYGNIIYANDFKLDNHPVLGQKPNYDKLKKLSENCLLLIMDSLYSNIEGKTPSEKVAREMLKDVLIGVNNKDNAIIVTTFSSHIARLKSIVEFGRSLKRKVVFLGRSLSNYVNAAENLNLINFGKEVDIIGYRSKVKQKLIEMQKHGRNSYLIVCTGNQGEPESILSRIAKKELPFELLPNDIVIFSCRTIPTEMTIRNREYLEKILKQRHVRIFTGIHTSGHASKEDHRDMINMLKPKNIIPTHGDRTITKGLEILAEEMGYKLGKNVHLLSDNKIIKIN